MKRRGDLVSISLTHDKDKTAQRHEIETRISYPWLQKSQRPILAAEPERMRWGRSLPLGSL
jgi:hypothetical protein